METKQSPLPEFLDGKDFLACGFSSPQEKIFHDILEAYFPKNIAYQDERTLKTEVLNSFLECQKIITQKLNDHFIKMGVWNHWPDSKTTLGFKVEGKLITFDYLDSWESRFHIIVPSNKLVEHDEICRRLDKNIAQCKQNIEDIKKRLESDYYKDKFFNKIIDKKVLKNYQRDLDVMEGSRKSKIYDIKVINELKKCRLEAIEKQRFLDGWHLDWYIAIKHPSIDEIVFMKKQLEKKYDHFLDTGFWPEYYADESGTIRLKIEEGYHYLY